MAGEVSDLNNQICISERVCCCAGTGDPANSGNLRQRLVTSPTQDEDLDALLKYNRDMQERIAENMILMTSSMKEHALTASSIIKRDISSLEKSDKLTDKNAIKLRTESLKLEEHTKSTWRCWVWLMVAFVLVVFFCKSSILASRGKKKNFHTATLQYEAISAMNMPVEGVG